MKKLAVMMTLGLALFAMPAFALDLHTARANGSVGEQADGFVAALKPDGEVNALVSDVNAKRTQEYARISKENGQPVKVVGTLAAQQIINGLPSGASYQGADGGWKKK